MKRLSIVKMNVSRFIKGICPPLLYIQLKRYLRWNRKARFADRHLRNLLSVPRFKPGSSPLINNKFVYIDSASFYWMYRNFFCDHLFRISEPGKVKRILDCGANIGVSVWKWKLQCPNAEVIAFEPDPSAFSALKENCESLKGVTLVQKAVWVCNGRIRFLSSGADGGHIVEMSTTKECQPPSVEVETIRLRDYLVQPINLLKMDIEGAEIEVLQDCRDCLSLVERLFVEYHSFAGKPQRLGQLITLIEEAGFRMHIHHDCPSMQPFFKVLIGNAKDMRLNIFCWRDEHKGSQADE